MIVGSLFFGMAIAIVGEEADPVLKFFTSITVIVMRITQWIIMLAPVGVMFLVAGQILEMGDLADTFSSLGLYFTTVMLGLTIHGFIVLPLLYGEFSEFKKFEKTRYFEISIIFNLIMFTAYNVECRTKFYLIGFLSNL
jgi:Na+/H+-dicarboxylate symporter